MYADAPLENFDRDMSPYTPFVNNKMKELEIEKKQANLHQTEAVKAIVELFGRIDRDVMEKFMKISKQENDKFQKKHAEEKQKETNEQNPFKKIKQQTKNLLIEAKHFQNQTKLLKKVEADHEKQRKKVEEQLTNKIKENEKKIKENEKKIKENEKPKCEATHKHCMDKYLLVELKQEVDRLKKPKSLKTLNKSKLCSELHTHLEIRSQEKTIKPGRKQK